MKNMINKFKNIFLSPRLITLGVIKNSNKNFIAFSILVISLGVLSAVLPTLASRCENNECFLGIYVKQAKTTGFPVSEDLQVVRTEYVPMTAYNSEVGQCDDTPCITANGFNLCKNNIENSVAANFLPLGTRVRIPELYEDRVFVVRDRMNKRYYKKMDIWMIEYSDAIKFGHKKNVKIEILES